MLDFNEISIGQEARIGHTITQEDVDKFINLTQDDNAVHTSGKYGKPVVHGMLTASFISTIIGTKLPGEGALWYSQTLNFINPVRVGDHLDISACVKEKEEKERILVLVIEIINQRGSVVVGGIVRVKMLEEPKVTSIPEKRDKLTALVVGGTGGIGRAVVAELCRLGFEVTATYHDNWEIAYKLKNDFGCHICQFDIKEENISANSFDVLVNCVAIPIPDKQVLDIDDDELNPQFDYNVTYNLYLAQEVYKHMTEQGYGKIIFIGSTIIDSPRGHWAHYIIAKEALWGLTKALSHEWAPKGIRVNMVSPSLVNTELTSDISTKEKLILESHTPLRRTTTPSDVAKVIGFLASEAGDSITGQNIRING
jgi:3-oxoacyl-[acyl-carrier protein] reductase